MHGWEWVLLPAPRVYRDTYNRPSLGLSRGVLTLTGGFDLDEVDFSGVIEEWDDVAGAWVETDTELSQPPRRQSVLQIPTRLLDHCD